MHAAEVEAIVGGYHGDAFRVLGPHRVPAAEGGDAWEVRAFLPQARSVELLFSGRSLPMTRSNDSGFFTAQLSEHPGVYRYRVTHFDGSAIEQDDPYRFPLLLTDFELHLYGEGTHYDCSNMLGAHLKCVEGVPGVRFAVWAPNAECVFVTGDFNGWDQRRHPMRQRTGGVWELFIPGLGEGAVYKYFVKSRVGGYREMKADPCAFYAELPPKTGSIVANISRHQWGDQTWMDRRAQTDHLRQPMSIYEVHLGSWLRAEGHRMLTYRELADKLVSYAADMGYTHLELLPITEHPFSGSWGYQTTGYFAPTSRHGTPEDFMYFVDRCHQAGIGVIVDWVPAHFPRDAHGLAFFDGTHLYEHEDERQREHPDWGTRIFNFGRNEVRSFLISSALFWLKRYHIDGLRVDAVASMLYLDYSRKEGEWIPNRFGGRENLEAIEFLKIFNQKAHEVPGAITVAEESTSFPAVSRPVYAGGLGFTMKWNMGWMHDMLHYIKLDPVYRKFNHNDITFSMLYAFSENFVLPISHDEVVHMKGSFLGKMPGDEWQRFANARLFMAYMCGHPGKKLIFMGAEIGQYEEWNEEASLRWDLLQYDFHRKLQETNRALNRFYRSRPELWEVDYDWQGFDWVDLHDVEQSTISFLRWSAGRRSFLLWICNFTPVVRGHYRIGVPAPGFYREVFNTDAEIFGGSNVGNLGGVHSEPHASHGYPSSITITLPPLAAVVFELAPAAARLEAPE
jgi:1,4-alpha-glucan branching enzyme